MSEISPFRANRQAADLPGVIHKLLATSRGVPSFAHPEVTVSPAETDPHLTEMESDL